MCKAYRFREWYIPPRMLEEIERYVDDGVPPSGFLLALLENNFKDAVWQADDENLRNLPAYAAYFYNEIPAVCWGSKESVSAWILRKM